MEKAATMLDYTKYILARVSFDQYLFRKELLKAYKWLQPNDKKLLLAWCLSTFGAQYSHLIHLIMRRSI